uniref:Uncharacterized protein n=1 Tax=Glossina brevipalpis TaxID=37001 RepID=A0A1A9X4K6_9MUSC
MATHMYIFSKDNKSSLIGERERKSEESKTHQSVLYKWRHLRNSPKLSLLHFEKKKCKKKRKLNTQSSQGKMYKISQYTRIHVNFTHFRINTEQKSKAYKLYSSGII